MAENCTYFQPDWNWQTNACTKWKADILETQHSDFWCRSKWRTHAEHARSDNKQRPTSCAKEVSNNDGNVATTNWLWRGFSTRPSEQSQAYLCQNVQLTGFDSDDFKASIETMQHLYQIFTHQVPEGAIEPLNFGQFGQYSVVEFSTRYFTSRHDDPHGDVLPFDRSTDPKGILANMSNPKYFYSEDNKVLYYGLQDNVEGGPSR